MDDDPQKFIYNNLNLRETQDLLDIWQKRDLDEWQEEVFEIIEQILMERLGHAPPQPVQADVNRNLERVERYIQTREFSQALSECELAI